MSPTYLRGTIIILTSIRGDTFGLVVFIKEFCKVDVSNKTNPQVLGHHPTPNQFTHNIWVSDDGDFVFTTDELSLILT